MFLYTTKVCSFIHVWLLFYGRPLGASFFLTKHFIHQYCPIKRGFLRDKSKWTEISRPKGSLIELTLKKKVASSSKVAFCIWKGVTHLAKMQMAHFEMYCENDLRRARLVRDARAKKMYRLTSSVGSIYWQPIKNAIFEMCIFQIPSQIWSSVDYNPQIQSSYWDRWVIFFVGDITS